jgi:heptosyltransferase-1
VPYAVAHPFGSTSAKWWPRDYIEDLAHNLRRDQSLRTIVVGGPETRGALGLSDHNIIDSRGALSVAELMAVIDEATVVISTDSGPFHIAGALGRPLVGLFRARRPEHAGRYRQAEAVYGHDETCDLQCGGDRCRELPCRQMRGLAPCYVMAAVRRALVSAERADRESVVGSRA